MGPLYKSPCYESYPALQNTLLYPDFLLCSNPPAVTFPYNRGGPTQPEHPIFSKLIANDN